MTDQATSAPPPVRKTGKRTRLSPQLRKTQILDDAARLILEEGLTAVSMERLGREAGISKALVYNYFPSRDDLLTALLHREQTELRDRGMATAMQAQTFGDLIRQTTRVYLEHVRDRGSLITALLSDPSVARLMEAENREDRDRTIRFFVKRVRETYGLPLGIAIASVDLLMAVTDGAGKLMAQGALTPQMAEDMVVHLLIGGVERMARHMPRDG